MPLSLYMDVHVPTAVTAGLRRRGVSVLTSHEDGTDFADDVELLQRAAALLTLHARHGLSSHCRRIKNRALRIAFARQNTCSIGSLIDDLQLIAEACSEE